MDEDYLPSDVIGFMIELAESGHAGAHAYLHEEYLAAWCLEEKMDPRLAPYAEPLRDKHRNRRTGRPRGRPPIGSEPNPMAVERPDNTVVLLAAPDPDNDGRHSALPRDIRAAVALVLARREGWRGENARERAAARFGGSPEHYRRYETKRWRHAAEDLLAFLENRKP